MIKELFLAIALGALLGFGVTGGYFALKNSSKPSSQGQPTPIPTLAENPESKSENTSSDSSSTLTTATGSNITINEPSDNSIVSTSKLTISGTTSADSTVIAITPLGDFSTLSDKNGKFEIQVNIELGVNLIKITSVDPEDNQSESQLTVTYSTAQF